ncbi:FKBP-type peptidyl-prolyl cis-trans isomerase [Defluviimonas sp. SAOS-178_SWC]|uniref:FKBP-type peptidyl-prolyl cis-trans isomerase n=1 Tax=Defluviimonas sp. SAOS-178_SWC TaxID=3121287 RepID=UPI0032217C3F
MTQVKTGDTVRIHYTGTLQDGTTFDSSAGRDPLEFTVGSGQIIPGLDRALPGMEVGEQKTVTIAPEDAYGPRHAEAAQDVPRHQIPPEIPLEIGTPLQMRTPDGRSINVTVAGLTEETVTLDANHPLAGKALTFAFEIVSIG